MAGLPCTDLSFCLRRLSLEDEEFDVTGTGLLAGEVSLVFFVFSIDASNTIASIHGPSLQFAVVPKTPQHI